MKILDEDFLDYLGMEERNFLASMVNFRHEFDLFYNVDQIYREPLFRLTVTEDEALVPQLYLFVHFHLYFSVSCVLRSHLSEALSSTRKAIDAALTAYVLILKPDQATAYVNRDKYFQFIKGNVQNEVKADNSAYPLAPELLKIHDACSEFGSHADISSFFHRLETKTLPDNKSELLLHYFQFPRNPDEYRFYFLVVVQAFYLMFRIFKLFFDQKLKIVDPRWEGTIAQLGPALDKQRQAAYERFAKHP
jgi:hypothetical protein